MKKMLLATLTLSIGLAAHTHAELVHRYSFDTDASDSIGSADGTLLNGARISGGSVHLNGINQYVNLDAAAIAINTYSSITVEAFWSHNTLQKWQRVFDFGDNTSNYLFYSPVGAPGSPATPSQIVGLKNKTEQFVQVSDGKLATGRHHMALTFDGDSDTMKLYVDGKLVGVNESISNTLSTIGTKNAYLGKAQHNDPYLNGSIDEFRIYSTALSSSEVTASFTAGPKITTQSVANPTAKSVTEEPTEPELDGGALIGFGGISLLLHN